MAHRIQLRGGTQAAAIAANPTLRSREIGIETDTGLFKVGDGSQAYIDLAYGGLHGETGNYFEFRFLNLEAQPPAPSGDQPVGWNTYPTSPVYPEKTWVTVGEKNSDNILQTLWSTPSQLSGLKGDTGETGTTGAKGDVGTTADPWTVLGSWDTDETVVKDAIIWISLQDANSGNDPIFTEGTWWERWPGQDSIIAAQGIIPYGEPVADYRMEIPPAGTVIFPLDGRTEDLTGTVDTSSVPFAVFDATRSLFYDASLYATSGNSGGEGFFEDPRLMTDKCRALMVYYYLDSDDASAANIIADINDGFGKSFLKITSLGTGVRQQFYFAVGDGTTTEASIVHLEFPVESAWNHVACWWNPTEAMFYASVNGVVQSAPTTIAGVYNGEVNWRWSALSEFSDCSFHLQEGAFLIRDEDLTQEEMDSITGHYGSGAPWVDPANAGKLFIHSNMAVLGTVEVEPATEPTHAVQKNQLDYQAEVTHPAGTRNGIKYSKGTLDYVDMQITSPASLLSNNGVDYVYPTGIIESLFTPTAHPFWTGENIHSTTNGNSGSAAGSGDFPDGLIGTPEVQFLGFRVYLGGTPGALLKADLLTFYENAGNYNEFKFQLQDDRVLAVLAHDVAGNINTPEILDTSWASPWDGWHYGYIWIDTVAEVIGISWDGVTATSSAPGVTCIGDNLGAGPVFAYRLYSDGTTPGNVYTDYASFFTWWGNDGEMSQADVEAIMISGDRFGDVFNPDMLINGPAAGNIVLDRPLITWGGAQTGNPDEVASIFQVDAYIQAALLNAVRYIQRSGFTANTAITAVELPIGWNGTIHSEVVGDSFGSWNVGETEFTFSEAGYYDIEASLGLISTSHSSLRMTVAFEIQTYVATVWDGPVRPMYVYVRDIETDNDRGTCHQRYLQYFEIDDIIRVVASRDDTTLGTITTAGNGSSIIIKKIG